MSVRVGLVLGAGGLVGQAYQAGVLAALEQELGWDPRTADRIVGTSAGSVTATLLRLGVPTADLVAYVRDEDPVSPEARAVLDHVGDERPVFPPFDLRDALGRWSLPSPRLIRRIAARPWAFRPSVAAITLLPPGSINVAQHTAALDAAAEGTWPEHLWLCVARRSDGARVVLGRPGSPPATLSAGVAASCAIPGYFEPVTIDGIRYFDGGVYSSTNADVLRTEGLDVVIVVASMSAAGGLARVADGAIRLAAHRRLDREIARLRKAGTTVVRIEPTARSIGAMGLNAMAADRADDVVETAFGGTARYIAREPIAARLAPLADLRADMSVPTPAPTASEDR